MSLSEQYDIGSRITHRLGLANVVIDTTATTQDGITVDRQMTGLSHYYSAVATVAGQFQCNSSAGTMTIGLNIQHSSDGTSWDNFSTDRVPSVTIGSTAGTTDTTAGTLAGAVSQRVNLRTARRYLRVQVPTPTFSVTSSGTFTAGGQFAFGGGEDLPSS